MAYYAVCELLIHFNAFKNVDLYVMDAAAPRVDAVCV